jgi:hypothetical protein
MTWMERGSTRGLAALSAALGLASGFAAGASSWPTRAESDRSPVLVSHMVSVTGTLRFVDGARADESDLEIASDLGGRFRIGPQRAAALRKHVGDVVTVVAYVEPRTRGGRTLLRVERFTAHSS